MTPGRVVDFLLIRWNGYVRVQTGTRTYCWI